MMSDAGHTSRMVLEDDPAPAEDARLKLRTASAFVFDMDGVLYRGGEVLPGVVDLLNALELRQKPYMLATNNSMASPADYQAKLAAMGIAVPSERVLTAGTATRDYLRESLPENAAIFAVGMPALREQLFTDTGFRPVQYEEEQPDAVVVGLDLTFTYDKLNAATRAIRNGALFVATNADATLPTENGLVPGAGSIVAAIATASGREPTVIGKPSPRILEKAAQHMGVHPRDMVMIGDRLDTDILAGHRAGMLTLLVLTGVSTREEIADAPGLPDLVFTDLRAVLEALVVETVERHP